MTMICKVCSHSKKIEIDRLIVQGMSLTKIAKKYGIPYQSVYNHSQKHLSRQLLKAWEIKTTKQNLDILSEVEDLIRRTKRILTTAETERKYHVALNAIKEARSSYELLSKIAFSLHQARLSELELERLKAGNHDEELAEEQGARLEVLSFDELIIFKSILDKMNSGDRNRRIRIPYSYVSRKDRHREKEPETITKDETKDEPVMDKISEPDPLAVKPDESSPAAKLPRRVNDWIA